MDFALDHRARDDCALHNRWLDDSWLDDRWLDDSWLDDRWLDNSRLHDCGLRSVGLLAVLLHLDGAAIDGLARGVGAAGGPGLGVGDRLLLDPRLRLSVILIDREAAGGDGAADAAERQDDEEYDDDSDAASAAGVVAILSLVFQAPLDAVVAGLPGFAPVGTDR